VKGSNEYCPKLFERYGSRCRDVQANPIGDDSPLDHCPDMTCREVAFLVEKEKVIHLDDLVLRRSLMAYLGHVNRPLINELAGIAADILGWSEEQKQAEVARTVETLKDQHLMKILPRLW